MEKKTEEIIAELEEAPADIKERHEKNAGEQGYNVEIDEKNKYTENL